MDNQLIKHLQDKYISFLTTEKGIKLLKIAIDIITEWNIKKTNCIITTNNIKLHFLNDKIKNNIHKITIIPIGLNNMCHITSILLSDNINIFHQLGYNIFSCPCGKLIFFELHTVNMYKNKYYDFTKDFNNEKQKYFLPFNNSPVNSNILTKNSVAHIFSFLKFFSNKPILINKGCKCNIKNISKNIIIMTEDEFLKHLENINLKL
jgi:hypothetical protein